MLLCINEIINLKLRKHESVFIWQQKNCCSATFANLLRDLRHLRKRHENFAKSEKSTPVNRYEYLEREHGRWKIKSQAGFEQKEGSIGAEKTDEFDLWQICFDKRSIPIENKGVEI